MSKPQKHAEKPKPELIADESPKPDIVGLGGREFQLAINAAHACVRANLWLIGAALVLVVALIVALGYAFVMGMAATFAASGTGNAALSAQASQVMLFGTLLFSFFALLWPFRGASELWKVGAEESHESAIDRAAQVALLGITLCALIWGIEWCVERSFPLFRGMEYVPMAMACVAPFAVLSIGSIAVGFIVLEDATAAAALWRTLRVFVASPILVLSLLLLLPTAVMMMLPTFGLGLLYLLPMIGALGAPIVLCATGRREVLIHYLQSPPVPPTKT